VPGALRVLDAVEMLAARGRMAEEWRVPVEELGEFGGLLSIPAAKGGHEVVTPVSVETVEVLRGLGNARSLFGCEHPTAEGDMHRALNEWLRECGVEGTQVAYLLRHRKAQALRRFGGVAAVSVGLGHVDEQMARRYSKEDRLVPALRR
jgi:integrase